MDLAEQSHSNKPRVVVMCCDGLYQRYLVTRIAEDFDLAGVVRHRSPNGKGSFSSRLARYRNPVALIRYLRIRRLLRNYGAEARPLVERLFFRGGHEPEIPEGTPVLYVQDINDEDAVRFVRDLQP